MVLILLLLKLFILVVISFVSFNLYLLYTRSKLRHFRHVPYPVSLLWALGVAPDIRRRQRTDPNMNIAKAFTQYHEETGWDVFVVHLFTRNIVFTLDLGMVSRILVDHRIFQKNVDTNNLMSRVAGVRLFGKQGLLNEPGSEVWYAKRRALDPAFHKSFLRRVVPDLNDVADRLVRSLESRADTGDAFDISTDLNFSALDAITRCGFNWDEETIDKHSQSSVDMARVSVEIIAKIFMERFTFNLPHKHRQMKDEFRRAVTEARNVARTMLQHRLIENSGGTERKRNDIFDHIISANTTALHQQGEEAFESVVDDYMVFLGAGMETTAITMSLTIFYLSVYPEVYRRVMEEISSLQLDEGNDDEYLDFDKVNQLVYLEMVIKECLRIKPPVPGTGRECVKEGVVLGQDYIIPRGTYLFVSQSVLQMDSRYWVEPEVFNPDRFHPKHGDKITAFTYMPFMSGPRSCIGKHFAMLEAKILICKFLKRYHVVNPKPEIKDVEVTGSITQRPVDGVTIRIEKRM